MSIDLATLKELFNFLKSKLVKEDHEAREKIFSLHPGLLHSISKKLTSDLAEIHQSELEKRGKPLPSCYKGINLEKERLELLGNINDVVYKICSYEALVLCTLNSFKQGLIGCQEHATLISLALMNLYGVNQGPRVENMKLEIPHTALNHEFVVYARAEGSVLDEVSSWGDCLVFDSYGHWFADINHLPTGTGIANFALDKKRSGLSISVFHDNSMGFDLLTRYKDSPDHPFHNIERVSLELLRNNLTSFVETSMAKLNLPLLRSLSSPSSYIDTFFATLPQKPQSPICDKEPAIPTSKHLAI